MSCMAPAMIPLRKIVLGVALSLGASICLGVYLPFDDALGLELVAAKLLETNIYDVEKHTRFWAQATYKF